MRYEGVTVVISLFALIVSGANVYFTHEGFKASNEKDSDARKRLRLLEEQVLVATQNYQATLDQLELYRQEVSIESEKYKTSLKELDAVERELAVSEDQIKLERERLEFEREQQKKLSDYSSVIGSQSVSQLRGGLQNLSKIDLSITNRSSFSTSYSVSIQSEGFGVHWNSKNIENKLLYNILLDDASIVIGSGETYKNEFLVVHGKDPARKGKIMIYVNDSLLREYCYVYQQNIRAYVNQNECGASYYWQ